MNNPNPSSHPNDDSASSAAEEDSSSAAAAAATTSTPLEASKGPPPPPPPTEKAETIPPAEDEEDEGHPPMALVVPEKEAVGSTADDPMDVDNVNPATVFCIRLKQPKSNLLHKMSVPELCRNFRCSNVSPLFLFVGV